MAFLYGVDDIILADSTTTLEALTVTGNLTVLGTQLILSTSGVSTYDNIIRVQQEITGNPTQDAGLSVRRSGNNALIKWDESIDTWQFGISGSLQTVVLDSAVQSAIAQRIPTGSIRMYGGAVAPTGWLLCDGSVVSQATYPALSVVCGTAYNTGGEGAGNFRLPDLRQRIPIGKADSSTASVLGQSGGSANHSHTMAHTHTMGNHTHTHNHNHTVAHTHVVPGHRHGKGSLAIGGGGNHAHFTQTLNCGSVAGGYGLIGGGQFTNAIVIWSNWNVANQANLTDTDSTFSNHSHGIEGRLGNTSGSDGDSNFNTSAISRSSTDDTNPTTNSISTNTTGGSSQANTGTDNPPYLTVNFIIKAA